MWTPTEPKGAAAPASDLSPLKDAISALAGVLRVNALPDLTRMRDELGQVRRLSSHAIMALQNSFYELDRLVREQQNSLDALLSIGQDSPAARNDLNIAAFVHEVGPLFRSLS